MRPMRPMNLLYVNYPSLKCFSALMFMVIHLYYFSSQYTLVCSTQIFGDICIYSKTLKHRMKAVVGIRIYEYGEKYSRAFVLFTIRLSSANPSESIHSKPHPANAILSCILKTSLFHHLSLMAEIQKQAPALPMSHLCPPCKTVLFLMALT